MKVIIFEVCRSPEIQKETEAQVLSQFFSENGIEYELYSNDGIWPVKTVIDKNFIKYCLTKSEVRTVHLAIHGDDKGLILKWSNAKTIADRIPEDRLTGIEIREIKEWNKKLIVSGACSSAKLASFFLDTGAEAVIAPDVPIDWTNLAEFFRVFYKTLFSAQKPASALEFAITQFPEFKSYHIFSN